MIRRSMFTRGHSALKTSATEEAQARAYLIGAAAGFAIPYDEWDGQTDGTAIHEDGEGTQLIHTPAGETPFTAVIPCRRHTTHEVPVTYTHDLDTARTATAQCSGDDTIVRLARMLTTGPDEPEEPHQGVTLRAVEAGRDTDQADTDTVLFWRKNPEIA